jgi:rod shape determining protein RodA
MSGNGIIPPFIANLSWRPLLLLMTIGGFGAIILYSASGGSFQPWAGAHLIRFTVFLSMALVLSRIPLDFWRTIAFPLYAVILILLIFVELLGGISGGSQRWLDLGFIRLQPSELMKLAIILAIARFYDLLPAGEIRGWTAIWPAALAFGFPALLVILQPDLGTALMIVAGGISVMFLAGLPLRLFVIGVGGIAVIAPLSFFFLLHDYQRKRVLIFLDPESDPLGAGYHITQSKIAIGSGGIFGKGFLNGSQSHLEYLPEGHTDFVFATMAEEWGLLGGFVIIFAFIAFIRWAMDVSNRAKTKFAKLTAAGLAMTIFFYFTINLMMVMGLAPVVGIPLPLVSHGGTAMLTVMLCVGIIMAIEREQKRKGRFR